MTKVVVIGAGMGALGADYRFRQNGLNPVLYDQAESPGGHTTTHIYPGGWAFDEGPHVSFTKDPRIQALLAEAVRGEFLTLSARVDNYWRGHRFRHPAICNLNGLPPQLVVDCIRDFVEATHAPEQVVENYEQWLVAAYGRSFAETFPMEYAKKVHTTAADQLGIDWLGPRLYRPKLDEVLLGALSRDTPDVHYVTEYRYPARGGFFSYLKPFLAEADVRSGHLLVGVLPKEQRLLFANGLEETYDHLISSVPLPDFISLLEGCPEEVVEASGKLSATNMVLVNVGINREEVGDTWTYFYDQDIVFTRVSYPGQLSPDMVPAGHGSFQAEIYFSDKYKPLTGSPEDYIAPTVKDLKRTGLIREGDEIRHTSALHVPYGNIIHDLDKIPALALIHGYLDEIGIKMCGRYGLWGYQWTDEAFITGEEAAQAVLDAI
ncbi:MAG TPA: NAD(P)-binding protein [Acidimicrobiia bacterium]|nr:NAD(P)-binding protein [Acidimicrobiia bacterium]